MRVIKFRAYSKMFEEYEMFYDVGLQIKEDGRWWTFNNNTRLYQSGERVKIMQYTGLKDKNGKEIYEGDVLHMEYETLKMDGYVKQKEDGEWIFYKDEDNFLGVHHNKDRIEIIGNIYENPELK